MTCVLRSCRRWTPRIVAVVAVATMLLGGLAIVAFAVGVLLMIALLTNVVARSRRDEARLGGVRRATVVGAAAAWAAVGLANLVIHVVPAAAIGARALGHLISGSAQIINQSHLLAPSSSLLDLLIVAAAVTSGFAIRSLLAPPVAPATGSESLAAARAIVAEYGKDSLSPFVLRPDKSFEFAGGGVLAYRVIGDTAVGSADPVGPDGCAPVVLGRLLRRAHDAGLRVVLYGSSESHLAAFRALGMRAMCVGEEAVVDPRRFTLEGRTVRKLRQSVNRVARRGWRIDACEGRDVDTALESGIEAVEHAWRSGRERMLGFAMSMGDFDPGIGPEDLYLLAWSPEGELQAVMRFISHQGNLSLDTMRRVGETPNGLNEALICCALAHARNRGVPEVSLNYAGLGHLVRRAPSGGQLSRAATRAIIALLSQRFQMDRLVLFNQKFSPEWRPRYLVYESRACLLRSSLRVLQAEGYLREPRYLRTRAAAGLQLRTRVSAIGARMTR